MTYLVTGGSGFLGKALVEKLVSQGAVYTLSRNPQEPLDNVIPLRGDVLEPNLGLVNPPDVDCVYHLAGVVNLGKDKDGSIWKTNVDGTKNIIEFCLNYNIPHLFYCSTAYTQDRNDYERSKAAAELMVTRSAVPRVTIIKPSIIIGSPESPGAAQNINQWAGTVLRIVRIHRKAERARRQIQDKLALPPIELGLRMRGNPESTLNVIPVNIVADEIIKLVEGTHYITNPHPPTVQEVASEIGEALSLNIHIMEGFKPFPMEITLHNLLKPFMAYMKDGPAFPSILPSEFRLPKGYIRDTVKAFLLNS